MSEAWVQQRISAGVSVEQDDRVLLVRHKRPGRYDFWVAPGGGVQGEETLSDAACREAREETGLEVEPLRLAYIEELLGPETRHCKFWFIAKALRGSVSVDRPEARDEHIVDVAWLSRSELGVWAAEIQTRVESEFGPRQGAARRPGWVPGPAMQRRMGPNSDPTRRAGAIRAAGRCCALVARACHAPRARLARHRDSPLRGPGFLPPTLLEGKQVFPPVLAEQFWADQHAGFIAVSHLGLRRMEFW